jgi:hypothetical protein
MGKSRNRSRIFAAGLAAIVTLGGAAPASADPVAGTAERRPASEPEQRVVKVWGRGVHVPAGILAGVPTGASPGGVRLRTVFPPYPVGFSADPYFTPPAVVTVPPPIVFAPPPFLYDIAPIGLPFYGGCFVPSDFAGQHGYYGSCADAFYRQWMSRPD